MALKDFIKTMKFDEELRVYNKNDILLFKGFKSDLQEVLYQKQTFAVKKIISFYTIKEVIFIIIE